MTMAREDAERDTMHRSICPGSPSSSSYGDPCCSVTSTAFTNGLLQIPSGDRLRVRRVWTVSGPAGSAVAGVGDRRCAGGLRPSPGTVPIEKELRTVPIKTRYFSLPPPPRPEAR